MAVSTACNSAFSSIPASTKQALSSASGRSVEVRIQTAGKGWPTEVKKLLSSRKAREEARKGKNTGKKERTLSGKLTPAQTKNKLDTFVEFTFDDLDIEEQEYEEQMPEELSIRSVSMDLIEKVLRKFPIEDVWGIGRKSAPRLKAMGIHTAYDYTQLPESTIRGMSGITGIRTWKELQGIPKQRGRKPAKTLQEYKYENKRLKMENELLRDFLSLTERKWEQV